MPLELARIQVLSTKSMTGHDSVTIISSYSIEILQKECIVLHSGDRQHAR